MCFHISMTKWVEYAQKRYEYWNNFNTHNSILNDKRFYLSGFETPKYPVVINNKSLDIDVMNWGLIPYWVKDISSAKQMSINCLNSRDDTIFDKPSFKYSIIKRRCLIPVSGFFEWQEINKKKYPYFIFMKDEEPFSLGGIFDSWINPETKEVHKTFSIITTNANPLLEKIHNTKKRMPLIIKYEDEKKWLSNSLNVEDIKILLNAYPDELMSAHTVSNNISKRGIDHNSEDTIKRFDYDELKSNDLF